MICPATGLPAVFVACIGFVDCKRRYVAVTILCLTCFINSGHRAGFVVNHIDISPKYVRIRSNFNNIVRKKWKSAWSLMYFFRCCWISLKTVYRKLEFKADVAGLWLELVCWWTYCLTRKPAIAKGTDLASADAADFEVNYWRKNWLVICNEEDTAMARPTLKHSNSWDFYAQPAWQPALGIIPPELCKSVHSFKKTITKQRGERILSRF